MSDGVTQAVRDNDISNKVSEINELGEIFELEPSIEMANKILLGLNELEKMPKGYRSSPPYNAINESRIKYQDYLSNV